MRKRLTAIGNSLGLIIERPILDLLNIDRETDLDIRTDGEALIIRPVGKHRRDKLAAMADRIMQDNDDTFRKLAK